MSRSSNNCCFDFNQSLLYSKRKAFLPLAANTALLQPPKTNEKVPKNSAKFFLCLNVLDYHTRKAFLLNPVFTCGFLTPQKN